MTTTLDFSMFNNTPISQSTSYFSPSSLQLPEKGSGIDDTTPQLASNPLYSTGGIDFIEPTEKPKRNTLNQKQMVYIGGGILLLLILLKK